MYYTAWIWGYPQKVIGNVFLEARDKICRGATIKERTQTLEAKMKGNYKVAKPSSVIDHLTQEMIKSSKKGPNMEE